MMMYVIIYLQYTADKLISSILSSSLPTVLFLSLRVEKEGLNCTGLRGELGMDLVVDETELVADTYADEDTSKLEEHHNVV